MRQFIQQHPKAITFTISCILLGGIIGADPLHILHDKNNEPTRITEGILLGATLGVLLPLIGSVCANGYQCVTHFFASEYGRGRRFFQQQEPNPTQSSTQPFLANPPQPPAGFP